VEDECDLRILRVSLFRMLRDAERTEQKMRRDRVNLIKAADEVRAKVARAARSRAADNESLRHGRGPQRYIEKEREMRERVRQIDANLLRNEAAQEDLREMLAVVDEAMAEQTS